MEIDRNRTELKQYFVKNAIPTERNFAELIDAMLNQRDDGIAKLPGNPLSIEASGDDTSQKKAIHFYNNFRDTDPVWVLSLNPRQDPNDAATARAGLSIGDGTGNSRLFIDSATGRLGVGTVGPLQATLHIDRGAMNDLALMLSSSGPGWGSGVQLKNTPAGGVAKTFGIYAGLGRLNFSDESDADPANRLVRMTIDADGKVGIGTITPRSPLAIRGVGPGQELLSFEEPGGNTKWHINQNFQGRAGLNFVETGVADGRLFLGAGGKVGIGTVTPQKKLHVQGNSSGPFLNDQYDRPAVVVTGAYPEVGLFSNTDNPNHGPTIRLGAYNDASANTFKHWVIGTAGRNASFLDIGYSAGSDANPHAGIRNYGGTTMLTIKEDGKVGIGILDPQGKLDVRVAGAGTWDRFVVTTTSAWGDGNTQYVTIGAGGAAGIMFWNPHVAWQAPEGRASIRYGRTGGIASGAWWDLGARGDGSFSLARDNGPAQLSISSGGNVSVRGAIVPSVGNTATNGIMFPTDPGGGGGDAAWIRYMVLGGETTKLRIGIDNDADDTLSLWQMNGERLLISSGLVYVNGLQITSDRRLKRDIAPLGASLERVLQLQAVHYRWAEENQDPGLQLGLIAQEVEAVFPEVVRETHEGTKAVDYARLIAPVIESIKEHQRQLDSLRREVAAVRESRR